MKRLAKLKITTIKYTPDLCQNHLKRLTCENQPVYKRITPMKLLSLEISLATHWGEDKDNINLAATLSSVLL